MANIRGLRDLNEQEEEEKRQAYYAGGQGQNGGGSGQQILDPREFMRRARDELGARSLDEYNAERQQVGTPFDALGAGRSLASAPPPSAAAPPVATAAANDAADGEQPARGQAHTITFWRDGFTVDDGPLRRTADPENAQFLADINRGQVPRELEDSSGGADIDVHCIDKSTEAYVPPTASLHPFTGAGHTMRAGPGRAAGSAPARALVEPREATVDASAPTTSVQLRMADGARKVLKLNVSHTVGDLRAHVATLTPAGRPFELAIAMPRHVLADDAPTLKEAGLLNNTLVVSLL
ncbi:hypothetical protein KFE25_004170 [Diacronema lutheri]|uniref:NSFL1 cofactor p47 n=2 Tax=Diacronema lutheri TaxID=2081491 RepID=A0A8J5X724_DIALT|nr:hypothetical protein KFE25_004170 [Diacronema lutheri]